MIVVVFVLLLLCLLCNSPGNSHYGAEYHAPPDRDDHPPKPGGK